MKIEILPKPNPLARDPLFYLSDYAELDAEYERRGEPSPHRLQWYFGMNIGKFSWMGHVRLRKYYRDWAVRPGFWRFSYGWTAQILWVFADIEVSWG